MNTPSGSERLAGFLRDLVPSIVQHNDDAARELVQTVVWLVGLSTGFLALLTARPEMLAHAGRLRPYIISASLVVVVVGVAQRLVWQGFTSRDKKLLYTTQLQLWAMSLEFDEPTPLQEWWTEEDLVERLSSLGSDPRPFQRVGATIDDYRKVYSGHLELLERFEKQSQERLHNLVLALGGKDASPTAPADTAPENADEDLIDRVRELARIAKRWEGTGTFLYWATGITFVASAALIAVSLLL